MGSIIFRVDSSYEIGSGHVVRCLTLADHLQTQGYDCIFICRELPGNAYDLIKEKKYKIYTLHSN